MSEKYIFIFCLCLFFSCVGESNPVDPNSRSAPSELQGSISGTLLFKDSPYYVVKDIYVDSLNTLIIEPGVRACFL